MLNTRVHQSEVSMATDTAPITEHGVATLPEQAWERARRRAEIIGPFACSPGWTRTNNLPINSRLLCQLSYRGKATTGSPR